jgi:hypothetical protein
VADDDDMLARLSNRGNKTMDHAGIFMFNLVLASFLQVS